MKWMALVPVKMALMRKRRLSGVLRLEDRIALTAAMLDHVLGRLRACSRIGEIRVLSPDVLLGITTIHDEGRGLNVEIEHAQFAVGPVPLVVVHADLPLLETSDIETLLSVAEASGQAIAPDRHLLGTNAVALADGTPIAWQFGADSFNRHRGRLLAGHAVVHRRGLAADCDTPDDLSEALASGFQFVREPALVAAVDNFNRVPR